MVQVSGNTGDAVECAIRTARVLIILLLVPISARAQKVESKGELRIYERATQIGTVASREFKDNKGRVVKVIYYNHVDIATNDFREQSTRTFDYDEYGCPIRSKSYDRISKLTRTEEVRCVDGTATRSLTIVRNSLGVKQGEARHTATGGTRTALQFDSTGEKVVAMTGELPSDTDLVHGWGNVLHGFALGIAANREEGHQQDLEVHVTIKNVGNDAGMVMVSPVLIDLKDSNGQVVEQKTDYRLNRNQTRSNECPSYLQMAAPGAGRAQTQYSFNLGEQYERLAPGKYSMTVTYCVPGVSERLVSNTIQIEVE